jgi:hypothetical protein
MHALKLSMLALLSVATAPAYAADNATDALDSMHHSRAIMDFQTMYGVDGPFIGEKNAIRGVVGDELPWAITKSIRGELDTRGNLTIFVRGLVFKDDPSVPPELRGINDEAQFRGLVSCLTENGDAVDTANVITEGFAATRSGNSFIHAHVQLPEPCVAPIVMVLAGSEDKWFAVTGVEVEADAKLTE